MFICRGCAKNKADWDEHMFRSKGPCENCHYTDICIDDRVEIDPNWKKNLEADLAEIARRQNA